MSTKREQYIECIKQGMSQRAVARKFNVSQTAVRNAIKYKSFDVGKLGKTK